MKISIPAFLCFMCLCFGAHADICGAKSNYVLQMWAPGNLTQVAINNLSNINLCTLADYVGGPGEFTPHIKTVQNMQMSAFGPNCTNTSGPPTLCQVAADITATGVSTTSQKGGLDIGTVSPNHDYCLWMVSMGDGVQGHTGIVWSANCDYSGPDATVRAVYPYYAYLGWNRTNALCPSAGCSIFPLLIVNQWVKFEGGTGSGNTGTGNFPLLASGYQPQWTALNPYPGFAGPGADRLQVSLYNSGPGGAYVTPNVAFGNNRICNANGANADQTTFCEVSSDRGYFGYLSNSPTARLSLVGFHDGQL